MTNRKRKQQAHRIAKRGEYSGLQEQVQELHAQLSLIAQQTQRSYLTSIARDTRPNSNSALFGGLVKRAIDRSIEIVESEMPDAMIFDNTFEMLRYVLSKADPNGAHAEFGVFSGKTIRLFAAARPDVRFDGFDSFEGLPEEWSGWQPFDFDVNGVPPEVPENVKLHIGWFEDTIPGYVDSIDTMSFMHVDCDIYSSTVTIFDALFDKIKPGTVIVFDEYFCYPNFEQHERRAFAEYLERSGHIANWVAVCGQRAACLIQAGTGR